MSEEAELTFLAVRRWFGWSSGRLAVFDIGGGSLEIATGADEVPEVMLSFELGAGRLTREWLPGEIPLGRGLPRPAQVRPGADRPRRRRRAAGRVGGPRRRDVEDVPLAGAGLRGAGLLRRPVRTADAGPGRPRGQATPKLAKLTLPELTRLPGVSAGRAHQLVAGGVVAEALMDIFGIDELEICPWALREGVILQSLDALTDA